MLNLTLIPLKMKTTHMVNTLLVDKTQLQPQLQLLSFQALDIAFVGILKEPLHKFYKRTECFHLNVVLFLSLLFLFGGRREEGGGGGHQILWLKFLARNLNPKLLGRI